MSRIINIFLLIIVILFTTVSCSSHKAENVTPDSFTVTVNNGYGSGIYKVGDTVHIFSNNYTQNQIFDSWSGDVSVLQDANEWHTWFIMPQKNITVTGNIRNSTPFTLQYAQIMGRDRLKPVYYYFPTAQKGIVYLLHGTSGSAANIVASYEWQEMIKDLIDHNFAVIITESEESTTGTDINGDGNIRWNNYPADTTTNVDYANIRIITNYFYNANMTSRSLPKYSIGMSNGGFFSAGLAYIYQYAASVQYCAQGSIYQMQSTNIPTQFCMAARDNNPSIGDAGNAAALSNSKDLNSRGVCSKFLINQHSPIYPERFSRDGNLSIQQSIDVYNELKSKGYIDNKNYYKGYSDDFLSAYAANPTSFPVINSLSANQRLSMLSQINISTADHHIYSDYNKATIKFLESKCQ